ncbi:MAG: pyridoxamine 5-phosphate oxidase [Acidimicrobiaceae bacterium]|nr:pyridoxamine 5-phosphate oxidase [Acidimicrobiaceae bacterium]
MSVPRPFSPDDLAPDPMAQFRRWFDDALAAAVPEPEAMNVATIGDDGGPNSRMVLLKQFDERGFVFFTNYDSQKGREVAARPVAALTWRWFPLERQVRATGRAERVRAEESDAYFATRPRGAQIGAWASPQSQVLANRQELEKRVEEVAARFGDGPISRPPWWGGIRVIPASVEFWQGRESRLHDRLRYRRDQLAEEWQVERLAP